MTNKEFWGVFIAVAEKEDFSRIVTELRNLQGNGFSDPKRIARYVSRVWPYVRSDVTYLQFGEHRFEKPTEHMPKDFTHQQGLTWTLGNLEVVLRRDF